MRPALFAICTLLAINSCNAVDSANSKTAKEESFNQTHSDGNNIDTGFAITLKSVLLSASTKFKGLQGKQLSLDHGQTVYESTLTLNGTSQNKIGMVNGRPYYMGKISEKVNEGKANELVKLWANKVQSILPDIAQRVPFRQGGGKSSELRDGVLFVLNNNQAVSIYWINDVDTEIYDVVITIV